MNSILLFATYIAAVVHPLEGRGTVSLPAASYIESDSPQELIREVSGQVTITNKTWMAWPASASVQLNAITVGLSWEISTAVVPVLTEESLQELQDWLLPHITQQPIGDEWDYQGTWEIKEILEDPVLDASFREALNNRNYLIRDVGTIAFELWRRAGYNPNVPGDPFTDPPDPNDPSGTPDSPWENFPVWTILLGLVGGELVHQAYEALGQPNDVYAATNASSRLYLEPNEWVPVPDATAAWSLSMLWENPGHFAQNIFKILESGTLPGITWNMAVWGGTYSDELLISRLSELPNAVHPWAEWPLAFAFASQVGFGDERIEGEFESIKPGPAGMLTDSLVLKGIYEAFNPPSWSVALKKGEEVFLMCEVGLAMRPELRITGPDYLTSYRERAEFGETVFIDKFVVNNSGLWQIKLDYQGSDNPLLEPGIQEHHVAYTLHLFRNAAPEQEPNNTLLCPQPVSLAEYASVVGRADNYGLWDIYQVAVNAGDRISMGVEPLEGEHNVQVAYLDTGCSCLQYGPTGGNTVPYSNAFARPLESGFLTIYVRGAWGQRYHLTLTRNGGQDTENRFVSIENQQTGSTQWTGRVGDYFDDGRARATTRQDEEDIYVMKATYPANIDINVTPLGNADPIEVKIYDGNNLEITPEVTVFHKENIRYRFMINQSGDHTITLKNHDGTAYKMEVQEERIEWGIGIERSNRDDLKLTFKVVDGFDHYLQLETPGIPWKDLFVGPNNNGFAYVPIPDVETHYRLRVVPKGVGK